MFSTGLVSMVWPVLLLLQSLVSVYCQTAPYIMFKENTLANHSYVDISQVGRDVNGSDTVQCRTDLETCCSMPQGPHRGDWYFPAGDRLPFPDGSDIVESRQAQRVDLRRNSGTTPTGIYRCDIQTVAVHATDDSVRASVYVGLYTSDGGITRIKYCILLLTTFAAGDIVISGVTLANNSDLNGDSPKFTLTCISTGGPATTVTWTRDSTPVTTGNVTVLSSQANARYTHTLTVTGRKPGIYTCAVENNKPSDASQKFVVQSEAKVCNI